MKSILTNHPLPRRAFLAGTATATAFTLLKPATVFGAEANSTRPRLSLTESRASFGMPPPMKRKRNF